MSAQAETLTAVRAAGRRVTPQRQVILDVIENSDQHLDAEAIFLRARLQDPGISLATVYRTLAVLKEMEIVEQRHIARDHAREHYEPVGAPEHHHFTCLGCRKVIEIQIPGLDQIIASLYVEFDIQIAHTCMCLDGYCRECAAKRQSILENG